MWCGSYSKAGFISFSSSQMISAGTIQGWGEFKEIEYLRKLFYTSSNMLQPIMTPERLCSLLELPHRLTHNYLIITPHIGFII